ncbi:hypothetical protein J4Q44_G00089980, partial [Coregonus suidteri]
MEYFGFSLFYTFSMFFVKLFPYCAPPKKLCRSTHKTTVILGKCNVTSPYQQWEWTNDMKCITHNHPVSLGQHEQCNTSARAPGFDQQTVTAHLPGNVYDKLGTFGLAKKSHVPEEQGIRVVIRGDQSCSNWTKADEEVDSGGRQVDDTF